MASRSGGLIMMNDNQAVLLRLLSQIYVTSRCGMEGDGRDFISCLGRDTSMADDFALQAHRDLYGPPL